MAGVSVRLVVQIVNKEAVRMFAEAVELLREAAHDHPWRDDLQEALRKLEAAAESLIVREDK